MPTEFAHSCRNFVGSDTFMKAAGEIESRLGQRVLTAKTPEERVQRGVEYDGFRRVMTFLQSKASEAEKDDR